MRKRCEDGKKNIPISINLSWMDFYDEKMMKWIEENVESSQKLESNQDLRLQRHRLRR